MKCIFDVLRKCFFRLGAIQRVGKIQILSWSAVPSLFLGEIPPFGNRKLTITDSMTKKGSANEISK
jgi:hypothetical protein